jgi:hypothetical protein
MGASAQGKGKGMRFTLNAGDAKVERVSDQATSPPQGADTPAEATGQGANKARPDWGTGSSVGITGSDLQNTIACTGDTAVTLNGSANDFTVTGECLSISVMGNSNKVKAEKVGAITVTGNANDITWKSAAGGKEKPSVSSTGTGNKVSQAK